MSSESEIVELLRTRPRNSFLPDRFYTDPEVFALDLEAIFHKQSLYMGCTCEVVQPSQ